MELISTAEQFPNLHVFRRVSKDSPVYSIVFRNKEKVSGWSQLWRMAATVALAISPAVVIGLLKEHGILSWTSFGIYVAAAAVVVALMVRLPRVRRTVELDFDRDRLRVLRGRWEETARQLTRLRNLTVEDHPGFEAARRQGGPRAGILEKQHCLIGWFGEGGAERVQLLTRWEWPRQDSLFEVRQAILWAIEDARQGPPQAAADLAAGDDDGEAVPVLWMPKPAGIKPPLD